MERRNGFRNMLCENLERREVMAGDILDLDFRLLSVAPNSGEILSTLHGVLLCGKDRVMHQGYCGKGGQSVPVSDGSPHILLTDAVVGGSGAD